MIDKKVWLQNKPKKSLFKKVLWRSFICLMVLLTLFGWLLNWANDYSLQHPNTGISATYKPIVAPTTNEIHYPYGVNQTDPDKYMAVLDLAERGNYQAQRNIAYGFVAEPYHDQQKNPVLGCSWYLVVLNSGSRKVDATDQENANLWCGKLDLAQLETSKYWASKFMATIEEKTKYGKLDD